MSIKITIPNSSSDVLTFGSGNTPTAAQIAGIDSGSSNGQLALYTTASGTSTERARIDSAGNLGVGVTPSAWASWPAIQTNGTFAMSAAGWSTNMYYSGGYKRITSGYALLYQPDYSGGSHIWYNATTSTADSAVTFTERMRIDSGGDLCVGMTASGNARLAVTKSVADYVVQAYNTNASGYGFYMSYSGVTPNNTGQSFYYGVDATALRFSVRSNGGIANYSANNVNLSDRREKTNFAPAKPYLDTICAIPVQTFNYIDQNRAEDDGLTLGVVAQDVQAVAPELVMESNWADKDQEPKMRLSIYQTDLQYALMKCIQEQQAIITSLTDRITALENK